MNSTQASFKDPNSAPKARLLYLSGAALALLAIFWSVYSSGALQEVFQPAWYRLGSEAFLKGDVKSAIDDLEDGLVKQKEYAPAYETLADCYIASRRFELALLTLSRLRSISPGYPHVSTRIAEASVLSDGPQLLRASREAVIAEPRSPRARLLLAYAMGRMGVGEDAIIELHAADRLATSGALHDPASKAEAFQKDPPKLSAMLKPLIFQVPY